MSVRGNRTHDLAHTGWMLSSRLCRPKPLSEYDMTCVLHVCWVRNVENVLYGGNPVADGVVGVKNSYAKLAHLKGNTRKQNWGLLLIRDRRKYLFIYQTIKLQ